MEIRQLELFIALAEERSFTRASLRMHIVQSGLSASLKELEDELGVRLIDRSTRHVSLTECGSTFLTHARTSLVALDAARRSVRSQDGLAQGTIRLGVLRSLLPCAHLPAVLQRFREVFPEVMVDIRVIENDTVPAQVLSGDLEISFHAVVGRSKWHGLAVAPFSEDRLVAVCSVDHILASNQSVRIQRLVEERFIDLTQEKSLRRLLDKHLLKRRLSRKTAFEVCDPRLVVSLVEKNLGVAVLPARYSSILAASCRIHILHIDDSSCGMPAWQTVIVTRSRPMGALNVNAIDRLQDMLVEAAPCRGNAWP